jgi:hypothetical protein
VLSATDAHHSHGISVSAWMTEAARQALVVRDGLTAVSEWERANGSFTPDGENRNPAKQWLQIPIPAPDPVTVL